MNNIENIYKFADSLACETKLNEPMKNTQVLKSAAMQQFT